jgi:shikimate dehydrogenase
MTYRFAVLGDPIAHSRSPELHAAMLELAGLDGEYVRVRAVEVVLAQTVDAMRAGRWNGLNITMPLKGAAARLADSISPRAELAESVNTLVAEGTTIHGESTDIVAFEEILTDHRFRDLDSILVLGAGGSAAAALAAIPSDRHAYVTARRMGQAELLTTRFSGEVVSWGTAVAGAIVVNTTPLGMRREQLPEGILEAAAGLIDLPYGERVSPSVADGHEFLLRQAIASFRLWTGSRIEPDALRDALRNV